MPHYRKICNRWESGGYKYGRCFIIPNHYNNSILTYLQMFAVAVADFPSLKITDVECSVVTVSHWCKGMPILSFAPPGNGGDFTIPTTYHEYRNCADFNHP